MPQIQKVVAREILNSRGVPTIEVELTSEAGLFARASSPSGASTGIHEAKDFTDGDARYFGKGAQKDVQRIAKEIAPKLQGKDFTDQKTFDSFLREIDSTDDFSKIGGDVALALSIAVCKLGAKHKKVPYFQYISQIHKTTAKSIPIPMFNVINGGAHADNGIAMQEFMVVPKGISEYKEQLRAGAEIYHALKEILKDRGLSTGVGDEGGFAPKLRSDVEALDILMLAISKAGYAPKTQISIALDIAISQFTKMNSTIASYSFPHQGKDGNLTITDSQKLKEYYLQLVKDYPILSIEDGLGEDDWTNWPLFTSALLNEGVVCVGDDFTVTNPKRLQKAISARALTGIIIKPNQVGTISDVLEVGKLCEENNIIKIVSHRSGETADTFIAHLAVGLNAQLFKDGATARSERNEKYNELLRIQEEL